MEFMAPLTLSC